MLRDRRLVTDNNSIVTFGEVDKINKELSSAIEEVKKYNIKKTNEIKELQYKIANLLNTISLINSVNIIISPSEPTNPNLNDLWIDSSLE